MNAELTAIVAKTEEPLKPFTCKMVPVANYKDSVANATLLTLNKPGGIAEWAALDGPRDETIFIVDPDSMFVSPVADPGPIPAGQAYSEEHDYLSVDIPRNKTVLDRHCSAGVRSRIQPVGIYILINRACLAELARRWLQKSMEITADPICRKVLDGTGWLSDMWGYCIAAGELGVHHHIREYSQVTGSNSLKNPITHFCYPLMDKKDGTWHLGTEKPILWSKWSYRPWTDTPDPAGATNEGKLLLERLQGLVNAKKSAQNGSPRI